MIVDYAIEGAPIDKNKYQELGFVFSDIDFKKREKKSKSGKNEGFEIVCDFTGFLINNENDILTIFPKHFPIEKVNLENDSRLLFYVLMKAQNKKSASAIGQDATNNFQSDYPFESFFIVYNYFAEFGLLFEDRKITKTKQGGRIKWKDTISKGDIYLERGKAVLFPFYYERKYNFSTFMTEVMVFVIDYTLMKFKYFIDLSDTGREFPDFDFLGSKEYVIETLYSYKEMEFRDPILELLDALIFFFTQINEGGNHYLKHYYFNVVWEKMVEEFLNGNFDGFVNGKLSLKSNSHKVIFKKPAFYPNSLNDSHYFQPDYYSVDKFGNQIILDAKYYSKINGMNYKQICYNLFLEGYIGADYPDNINTGVMLPSGVISGYGGYPLDNDRYYKFIEKERIAGRIVPKYKNVFSALILPSEVRGRKQHFQLSSVYAQGDTNFFISEEYFNIKEVMQYYLDKRFNITDD